MPFPDLPIPDYPQFLYINDPPSPGQTGPAPHIYAFDAPKSPWSWIGGLVRLRFTVAGNGPTNLGVYGPNCPSISGQYGLLALPGVGIYGRSYVGTRSPKAGRCYLVVRFESAAVPNYVISVARD